MILLDIGSHAAKEIARIKSEAEQNPISEQELHDEAENNNVAFPSHLITMIPQGWRVGYVVEQQPNPFGTWRRLFVTLDLEQPPPQDGIIKLMEAFGFECEPQDCLWVPDQTSNVAAICVMEPLGGRPKMEEFYRRMAIAEAISEAQSSQEVNGNSTTS